MSSLTTKKAIAFAFKQLLTEKPFNHISVNEIASKCDIIGKLFIIISLIFMILLNGFALRMLTKL